MKYLVLFEKGNLKDFNLDPENVGLLLTGISKDILSAVDYMENYFNEEFLTVYRYKDVKHLEQENSDFKVYTENQLMKYYNYKGTK